MSASAAGGSDPPACPICEGANADDATDVARVRSNVRRFQHERFTVWRCPKCDSLHCREAVDLDPYYEDYPFGRDELANPMLSLGYRTYVRRLRRAGFGRADRILDFGCGAGLLVERLRRAGFERVEGYDRYEPRFDDPARLEATYDGIILQDVLEHADDPNGLLEQVRSMLVPGGRLCIGTPNASEIDLTHPERHLHPLHQPYHRHILSESALVDLLGRHGLAVRRVYRRYYMDHPLPVLNVRFVYYYLELLGGSLDAALEPIRFDWRLLAPRGLATAAFGWLNPIRTELMVLLESGA